mmetsp:Transcript_71786/g.126439  ORF Transcript_71786/g.126439 Transcript_71786/m.126439 type:complete len:356 (+) Transcript_71786:927-1994(+)
MRQGLRLKVLGTVLFDAGEGGRHDPPAAPVRALVGLIDRKRVASHQLRRDELGVQLDQGAACDGPRGAAQLLQCGRRVHRDPPGLHLLHQELLDPLLGLVGCWQVGKEDGQLVPGLWEGRVLVHQHAAEVRELDLVHTDLQRHGHVPERVLDVLCTLDGVLAVDGAEGERHLLPLPGPPAPPLVVKVDQEPCQVDNEVGGVVRVATEAREHGKELGLLGEDVIPDGGAHLLALLCHYRANRVLGLAAEHPHSDSPHREAGHGITPGEDGRVAVQSNHVLTPPLPGDDGPTADPLLCGSGNSPQGGRFGRGERGRPRGGPQARRPICGPGTSRQPGTQDAEEHKLEAQRQDRQQGH